MKQNITVLKYFILLPFLIFFFINIYIIPFIDLPSEDDALIIAHHEIIKRGEGVSTSSFGFLTPLLFFPQFGSSIFVLRITQTFFLLLALIVFFKLDLSYKRKFLGLLLISASPLIIPGRNEVNFLPFFVFLSLFLLQERNIKRVFLSFLILGFGSSIKLVVALFGVPFLFFFNFREKRIKVLFVSILGFMVGLMPYIFATFLANSSQLELIVNSIYQFKRYEYFEIFSYLKDFFKYIPHEFNPTPEFFEIPLVKISFLFLTIYFPLFFYTIFVSLLKRDILAFSCLFFFLFLPLFNPTFPKPIHLYVIFPLLIFLLVRCINEKYLYLLIFPLIGSMILSLQILIHISTESFFPTFSFPVRELFLFLRGVNAPYLVTSLGELKTQTFTLGFEKVIVPIKYYHKGVGYDINSLAEIGIILQSKKKTIFVFPSSERLIYYRDCYQNPYSDTCQNMYLTTEIIKRHVKNINQDLKLIKTIRDNQGYPVYEIYENILQN